MGPALASRVTGRGVDGGVPCVSLCGACGLGFAQAVLILIQVFINTLSRARRGGGGWVYLLGNTIFRKREPQGEIPFRAAANSTKSV